jgi:2-polyprenyl-6-hydroxyphenyl methylase/3-demethylubiquinone-9 3-methyltransferase
MSVGARVRAAFGPYEPLVSNLWRAMFVDVAHWTNIVVGWHPKPRRILEVGCGEGYSTARLARAFPGIPIEAIDIAGHVGRLYDGPLGAVRFHIAHVEEIAASSPAAFDLIVLSDVLHHVPPHQRRTLLEAIHAVLAPGGTLAFKDWHRAPGQPIHWAVFTSDRYLTGDQVHYLKREEARTMLGGIFGRDNIVAEASVRPWKNNYAFHIVRK